MKLDHANASSGPDTGIDGLQLVMIEAYQALARNFQKKSVLLASAHKTIPV
ncbi:hypothetical protein [Trichocoleus sp. FACHB-262]|uniref:hypothetical protein n=1 Tax=Trichocoleus sp. FACHB-262 TaxID=2692869 RepID=UPI001686AF79|nr:hypothetical protein [Trichocoleus sp. FACHB-262]MBD2119541.1 hypothetical protein [Trichocoleus sp. FACHB-262]